MAKLKGKALAAARKNIKKARAAIGRKRSGSKKKRSSSNRSKRSGSSSMARKGGSRKGTSMKTRLVKFGAGAGIGALIAIVATAARRQEINSVAPIIDAAAGTGVEGQVGTAIMRVGVPLITRALRRNGNFSFGNSSNGSQMMAAEGA